MSSNSEVPRFHWADYLLFGATLAISAAVGIYYAIADRRKTSTEAFLMGGRSLNPIPVAISIFASFLSAISLLGIPSDTYSYGWMICGIVFSYMVAVPFTTHFIIPVFHRLEIKSMYEYFDLRYRRGHLARTAASIVFTVQMIFYMAVVLYAPSLALSQVTGIPLGVSIVAVGGVCTLYTTLGGMKAVVWTDTIQMVICFAGLLAVVIQGTIMNGGVERVWARGVEGKRIQNFSYDPNPSTRYTFWSVVFGGIFQVLTISAANQATIQRFMTIRTLRGAQLASYMTFPCTVFSTLTLGYCGILAYAHFDDCDPLLSGKINNRDQLIPLMVMEVLGFLPGLPGLFLASVFSAALSTVSSGLNSLAAVILEDFIKPRFASRSKALTDRRATIISQAIALFLGLMTIGLAFVPSVVGTFILQLAFSLFGMTGGPLLGMLFLALFFPCSNVWGSVGGLVCGLVTTLWIGIGAIIYPTPSPFLEITVAGCNDTSLNTTYAFAMNATYLDMTTVVMLTSTPTVESPDDQGFQVETLYTLSYLWYSTIGCFVTMLFGIIISFLTGRTKGEDVDPSLVVSVFDKLCCCLPAKLRARCRCGVDIDDFKNNYQFEEKEASSQQNLTKDQDIAMNDLGIDNHKY